MTVTNSTSAPVRPAPMWLRALVADQTDYQEVLGWPVTVQVAARRLVMPTGALFDALALPGALGEKVLAELRITMLVGPVIADVENRWWTFLTEPRTASRSNLPADVRQLGVHAVPRGAHVTVPSREAVAGSARWIERPRPRHPLPPWSGVVGATRRIAARGMLASQHTGADDLPIDDACAAPQANSGQRITP